MELQNSAKYAGGRKLGHMKLIGALLISAGIGFLSSCGGGGGSGVANPTFAIVLNPSTLGVVAGGTTTLQVSIGGLAGFSSSVSVSISDLASGFAAQPTSFTLSPNGPAQQVTLSVATSVANGSYTAAVKATGGGSTGTASATLTVGPPQGWGLGIHQYSEIVVPVGGSGQLQIPTTLCCPPEEAGYQLNLSISGLPPNVTASFSPNPIAAGATTTLTVAAAADAPIGTNYPLTLTITPSIDLAPGQAALLLEIVPVAGTAPDTRTDFIRTDGAASNLASIGSASIFASLVYDAAHQLIYASNPGWNRVDIVSPVTKQILRSVSIPAPEGVDLSPDGTRVYVSSDTQQMFAIDTTTHAIAQQWMLPNISGFTVVQPTPQQSYGTLQPVATSNGTVLLFANITGTGADSIVQWNPTANTVTALALPANFIPSLMAGSADGTKVIISSGSGPGTAVIYDSASNSITAKLSFTSGILGVAANAAGTQFIIFDTTNGLVLYDAQLTPLGGIPPGAFDTGAIFSPDGTRIYVVTDVNETPMTFTVDASTLQVLGTAPAYATIPPGSVLIPPYHIEVPYAVDSTGLIFGTADGGIALDDTTNFQNLVGPPPPNTEDKTLVPDAGPINVSTPTAVGIQLFAQLPNVWFGNQRGTNASLQTGYLQVTAPPSPQPDPVSVKILQPDGIQIFDPLAFSYGPVPMFLSGDAGSPDGGATADIIAIGIPNDPSAIQVSVGGASAAVLGTTNFDPLSFNEAFPTVDVQVRVPAGTTGQADVTLTTSAGSATLPKAYQYGSQVADYPSTDSFEAVTYDPGRNQLYLTAGDHVDVFSLSSKQFTAPMALPSAGGKKQFVGMALTPDGTKLVVTNLTDGSVDIVNPDNPTAATAIAIAPVSSAQLAQMQCVIGPTYVATTSTAQALVVYGGNPANGCGPSGGQGYLVNVSTFAVSALSSASCPQGDTFVSASRDGSKIALGGGTDAGDLWYIYDSASNTCATRVFYGPNGAAAAGDANVFAANLKITNSQANLINAVAIANPYYPAVGFQPLYLEKVNDSGSLLYLPNTNSVDITDVAYGILRQRVSLSEKILTVADAMAIDPTGQNIFLITDHGLTIVTLSSVPISIGSVTPATGAAGGTVTVRGSGFVQGTTASLNGQAVVVTFVDADTLTLAIPASATGAVQFTISNPNSQTYTLDDAFTVD